MINNAGVISWEYFNNQDIKIIKDQINTNFLGLVMTTKLFLPYINDVIINIGSGAGKNGIAGLSTYCATKFAVRGFSEALAKEFDNIKVYTVNPKMTATRMTNYKGDDPKDVANIIYNAAKGEKLSGYEFDVWDYI